MTPISRAIYPNYFSVPDASNTCLLVSTGSEYSASASPQLTFNGTTLDVSANLTVDANLHVASTFDVSGNSFLKRLDVSGNLTVFGNTSVQKINVATTLDVSGNSYLKQLDVSGNLTVFGNTVEQNTHINNNLDVSNNLTITGNVLSYGTISARQYLPGQVVNLTMLGYTQTDLSQNPVDIIGATPVQLFSYSYTPKISNSYIVFEYQTIYSFSTDASSADIINAVIKVNGTEISRTYQQWNSLVGGGTRSGTMFPIVGRYPNTSTVPITITIFSIYTQGDDVLSVNGDNSTWLKITEIARA
jgi:hypothetical protein